MDRSLTRVDQTWRARLVAAAVAALLGGPPARSEERSLADPGGRPHERLAERMPVDELHHFQAADATAPPGEFPAVTLLPSGWITPPFYHRHPDDPGRHRGLGIPLTGTSWLNRPFHAGWLVGTLFGGPLNDDLQQETSLLGGYRLGWDFDHYWGAEGRWAFAHMDIREPLEPEFRGLSRETFWDASLQYYPWGDSRWRPYFAVGLGVTTFDFRDADGVAAGKTLLTIPLGTGWKYYWKKWLALRVSLTDHLAIGHGVLDTMHNVSLTADVEVHWGGSRPSYSPYHGSLHSW